MPKIEQIWATLIEGGVDAQIRVSGEHPCDLYADLASPALVGLVAICDKEPPFTQPMRAITTEIGQRADGRWTFRLTLGDNALFPVFAALCNDIIASTQGGVGSGELAQAISNRIHHWRALLERDSSGLSESVLRGILGELLVLETKLLSEMSALEALRSWQGPFGTAQDFLFSDGRRLEVKAVERNAQSVVINGLAQLDPGPDELTLAIVRLQSTGSSAPGAITPHGLVTRLAVRFAASDIQAEQLFHAALAQLGWHDHPSHCELAVHLSAIEAYIVGKDFPRLLQIRVPAGVEDATYVISLQGLHKTDWFVVS